MHTRYISSKISRPGHPSRYPSHSITSIEDIDSESLSPSSILSASCSSSEATLSLFGLLWASCTSGRLLILKVCFHPSQRYYLSLIHFPEASSLPLFFPPEFILPLRGYYQVIRGGIGGKQMSLVGTWSIVPEYWH